MIPTRQAVLDLLQARGPLSKGAIKRHLQWDDNKAHRVLLDLQCLGYVTKSGSYRTNLWSRRNAR